MAIGGDMVDSESIERLLALEGEVGKLAAEEWANCPDSLMSFLTHYSPINDIRATLRKHERTLEGVLPEEIRVVLTQYRQASDVFTLETVMIGFLLGFVQAYRQLGLLEIPDDSKHAH
jgi:hypothetical protein